MARQGHSKSGFGGGLPLLLFILSLVGAIFLAGVAVGKFQLFPYRYLNQAWDVGRELLDSQRGELSQLHRLPAAKDGAGVVTYNPELAQDGVTLFSRYNGETFVISAIDMDGALLQEWAVPPEALGATESPNTFWDLERNELTIHGLALGPKGELVFNYVFFRMVALEACGDLLWDLDAPTHHAVTMEGDEIWTLSRALVTRDSAPPGLPGPFWDDEVLILDDGGKVLERISVVQAVFDSGYEGLLFDHPDFIGQRRPDLLHINDIKRVTFPLAARLRQAGFGVDPGDILLSSRFLSALFILDRQSHEVIWSLEGPFLFQHDPVPLADGTLLIYDNRTRLDRIQARKDGPLAGGASRLIKIDPVSREILWQWPTEEDQVFYSAIQGMTRVLDNGNLLTLEANGGRLLEIEPESGEIVWEYINSLSDDPGFVGRISDVLRLPESRYRTLMESCESS